MSEKLVHIKDYIQHQKVINGLSNQEVADILGVQPSMSSKYMQNYRTPSLEVAKNIYRKDLTVIHPYSKDSLEYEIAKPVKKPYVGGTKYVK